ncbi:hypothetical protein AUJ10_01535 [Candidatus Pacearchaeota archaeon CG1_02_31_27]|nr:MAG: hypothetical protein AUJ10_01535 [Candidatus Pacearchaeota archaeon CG1_02_31_27]PIN92639.1 MAG: hypothetical protein COU55_00490 [Candidatus Pacearchaeota archaeon CG10_big_fil_rev_8_21_14_0_10_31_59]PIZ81178.1 MAG: hypothetical protein COX99_00310 [Candidatus Pacearchaeota archaeon CG_4_10_14_0_2_um_filter_31_10]
MKERGHILEILKNAKVALEQNDSYELKKLSNMTIHTASISKDVDSISVAVTIYALSKIIEKDQYKNKKEWPDFIKNAKIFLEKAIANLEKDDVELFRRELTKIRNQVNSLSGDIKTFFEEVFRKAMLNKAKMMYEHGISAEETASVLGISQWELIDYFGKAGSVTKYDKTTEIETRVKYARKIFS